MKINNNLFIMCDIAYAIYINIYIYIYISIYMSYFITVDGSPDCLNVTTEYYYAPNRLA